MAERVNCRWHEQEMGEYDTDCGECFSPSDGSKLEWVRYCCWCGRPVNTVDYQPEYDDA